MGPDLGAPVAHRSAARDHLPARHHRDGSPDEVAHLRGNRYLRREGHARLGEERMCVVGGTGDIVTLLIEG